jgi:UDPglucose 6-dehydrogenase/GDP-mannose 6-dehydrogenase
VASNPEFLTEGRAVVDFREPDRIVIGVDGERGEKVLRDVYSSFDRTPLLVTNARTAEMIKYASNALLATMISFTNELANLGAAIGDIDTSEVMMGVHLSRYLTTRTAGGPVTAEIASFLEAGCGFGGSCLPKDVDALSAHAERVGTGHALLDAVLETNGNQPSELVNILERELGSLEGSTVVVLGLAFKPDTSDIRETPAVPVIEDLLARGARVVVHDPIVQVADLPESIAERVTRAADLAHAVEAGEAIVLVTKWDEYQALPQLLNGIENAPLLVDGRRVIDPESVPRYSGIGY